MDDTISRKAAIDALHTWFRDGFDEDKWWNSTHVLAAIEGLPPAEHGTNLAEVGTDVPDNNVGELISRKQAIDAVRATLLSWSYMPEWRDNKIIEAVEQLPPANCSEFPNNSDTISRQAAIDAIGEKSDEIYKTKQKGATYPHDDFFQGMAYAEDVVKRLPSAQPEQRTGKWIKLDMHRGMADHKCTACGQECYVPACMGEPLYAFCPNCGAKMEVTT